MKRFQIICAVLSALFIWMDSTVTGEAVMPDFSGAEEAVSVQGEEASLDWFE